MTQLTVINYRQISDYFFTSLVDAIRLAGVCKTSRDTVQHHIPREVWQRLTSNSNSKTYEQQFSRCLSRVCRSGDPSWVFFVLVEGAAFNPSQRLQTGSQTASCYARAVQHGNAAALKALSLLGVDFPMTDLHDLIRDHPDAVRQFLSNNKIRRLLRDNSDAEPFTIAIRCFHFDIAAMLLSQPCIVQAGFHKDDMLRDVCFLSVPRQKNPPVAFSYARPQPLPSEVCGEYNVAQHIELAKLLISKGASVMKRAVHVTNTVLGDAIASGNMELAEALLPYYEEEFIKAVKIKNADILAKLLIPTDAQRKEQKERGCRFALALNYTHFGSYYRNLLEYADRGCGTAKRAALREWAIRFGAVDYTDGKKHDTDEDAKKVTAEAEARRLEALGKFPTTLLK